MVVFWHCRRRRRRTRGLMAAPDSIHSHSHTHTHTQTLRHTYRRDRLNIYTFRERDTQGVLFSPYHTVMAMKTPTTLRQCFNVAKHF